MIIFDNNPNFFWIAGLTSVSLISANQIHCSQSVSETEVNPAIQKKKELLLLIRRRSYPATHNKTKT